MSQIKNRVQLLLSQGKMEKALEILEKVSKKKPRDAENLATLGFVYGDLGVYDKAESCLKKSLHLKPDTDHSYRIHCALGSLFEGRGQFRKAITYYKKTIELNPDQVQIYMNLGLCLKQERRIDEALDVFNHLINCSPENYRAYLNMAQIYEQSHRLNDARKHVELALKYAPNDVESHFLVAQLDLQEKKVELAEARLSDLLKKNMPSQHRAMVTKELGRILDKKSDYPNAFKLLSSANKIFESLYITKKGESDQGAYREEIDAYRECFSREAVANWPIKERREDDIKIVFLVGSPRSGTTLTEQIIESLPDFIASHEVPVIPRLVRNISKVIKRPFLYPEDMASLTNDEVMLLRAEYILQMEKSLHCTISADKFLLDKLPLNIVHIGFIARVFPETHILVALRDPRDVCLSCFTQTFNYNQAMRQYLDIDDTVKFYACVMDLWLHYREVLDINALETRYEDIVDDLEVAAKRILEFIGVAWNDDVLSFYDSAKKRQVFTPSYQNVTQPIYRGAINKWKNYEQELVSSVKVLDPFIREFGY